MCSITQVIVPTGYCVRTLVASTAASLTSDAAAGDLPCYSSWQPWHHSWAHVQQGSGHVSLSHTTEALAGVRCVQAGS